MESEKHDKSASESFWRSLFADLQGAGLLRGNSPHAQDRPAIFNAHLNLPLASIASPFSGVRVETLLRAAWSVVLARHTSSNDVLFFSSFNDSKPWLAPLRVQLPVKSSVSDWLLELDHWLRSAEQQGPVPANLMVQTREEGLSRSLPTFLIVPPDAKVFPPRDQIKGPILVVVRLDISIVEVHYDNAWFDAIEVHALASHLNSVLEGIAANPTCPVGKLPVLTAKERQQLLVDWNATALPFAENTCIHEFFEQQAARTPEATAVVFCDQQWSYRELNTHADAMAARLRAAGVGPGTYVAICLHRSLELMATLFGILKAGGAYIPLDPAYPAERLTFMVDDAKPAVIVVSKQTATLFPHTAAKLFRVDRAETDPTSETVLKTPVPPQSTDPAYVLYTSGSTGKPKGVVITHRNVSNFFTAMDGVIGTTPGVWLAVTSINFDISVFELFWTLARGFRIVLQEEGQWASAGGSKFSLPAQLKRHGVTHLQCTPSLASMLICDSESVAALRPVQRFMVGGEPLPLDLAHRLTKIISGDLINLYGPTETTVWSASQHIRRNENQILIGRPVANNRLYILDPERELIPTGSVGELYIGGDGLAQGYLNRPDITAERFITHEFAPGQSERLYRTGDLARYTRDGRIEFMGRVDQQIKIRGVRVELGEIEVVLREHPDIRDAVVVVQEDEADDKRLVAYVIASVDPAPGIAQIQQWLGTKLPKILVPSSILFLNEFPKTPNGKLDRRALPRPDQKASEPIEGAANNIERQIAAIWCQTLGVTHVGLEERFFDIGGHSLLMIEVHDKIRDKMGYRVALLDLFQYPTIRSLAQRLGQRSADVKAEATGYNRGKLRQQLTARRSNVRNTGSLHLL
jgi:amino acid adenylation domain-containing protein